MGNKDVEGDSDAESLSYLCGEAGKQWTPGVEVGINSKGRMEEVLSKSPGIVLDEAISGVKISGKCVCRHRALNGSARLISYESSKCL
jgi:hypothetical protein